MFLDHQGLLVPKKTVIPDRANALGTQNFAWELEPTASDTAHARRPLESRMTDQDMYAIGLTIVYDVLPTTGAIAANDVANIANAQRKPHT